MLLQLVGGTEIHARRVVCLFICSGAVLASLLPNARLLFHTHLCCTPVGENLLALRLIRIITVILFPLLFNFIHIYI